MTKFAKKQRQMYLKKHEQYHEIQYLKARLQDKNIAISELKKLIEKCKEKYVETKFDKPFVVRQPNAQRIPKPPVLGKSAPFSDSLERKSFSKTKSVPKTNVSERVIHITNVSRPQLRSTQMKDKVMPNNSQVKDKKTEVEDHNNHYACVSKFLNDVNARTKKPNVVPISTRKPKSQVYKFVATPSKKTIVQLILFIVDSGCTKHMTGNLKLLCNFVEKYLGTVHFGNDQFAPILGYGDLICRLLSGNLLVLLEIFRETIYSPKDVVIGLPKLKYVKDQLCSSCEVSKAKRISFKTKTVPSSKERLNFLHMDLCGPMRVKSINGKKYILVIVDDYSRYTWTLFLQSKDETLEVLKDFLKMSQRNLQAQVISVRTDKGTEFLNKALHAYFKEEGIENQTSTPRTPEQNGVVERRNHTLVEAARMMLSASKLPLDGENLDKMKEKGDPFILVGYSTQSKGYRVYNKRTRLILESTHIKFDEIEEMSETPVANDTSGLVLQR
ncbi:retrovirus-related pol polyprotein from transposon TNT 1-94 [Tanacetum coccineum]